MLTMTCRQKASVFDVRSITTMSQNKETEEAACYSITELACGIYRKVHRI